ncbi:MAG TPA: macro domain-containing protein [Bacteroidales bacterium]|nr:macro domain-containing protein [Bacteroidales bacterium]
MAYIEILGNIFNSQAMALVNTVNCVGVMGKGIALEFRLRFPEMFKEYQKICTQHLLKPGQILLYKKSYPWILNFAIKDDWKNPSKKEWIEETLKKFCENYKNLGINSVAFPWMGAMNGGLPLDTIKSITRKYLQNLPDIEIEIYEFDTSSSDPLFEKLKKLLSMKSEDLVNGSGIQARYWVKIQDLLESQKVNSLFQLCNYRINDKRVIGKTNIERLYAFLSSFPQLKQDQLMLFEK